MANKRRRDSNPKDKDVSIADAQVEFLRFGGWYLQKPSAEQPGKALQAAPKIRVHGPEVALGVDRVLAVFR